MTDEMTIQQRRSPLVPTVLGAAAGATGGALVGHWMTKPMTHEDVIAEVNAKDKFEVRVKEGAPEAATWQEVKNKADEVAVLKEKLDQAKKGEPKDPTLAKNLENARNDYENAIKKLTETKTEVNSTGTYFIRQNALEKAEGITTAELKSIEPELTSYYTAVENLRAKQVNAHGSVIDNPNFALKDELKNFNDSRTKAITDMYNKKGSAKKNAESYIDGLLPKKPRKNVLKGSTDVEKLNLAKYLSETYGEGVFKIHDTKVIGNRDISVFELKDVFGTGKNAWVEIDNNAYDTLRDDLIEKARANTLRYKELNDELLDVKQDFFKSNETELKNFGINSVDDLKDFKLKNSQAFTKDLEILKSNIDNAKLNTSPRVKTPSSFGTGTWLSISDAEKLLADQQKKFDLMVDFGQKQATIIAEQGSIIKEDPFVRKAKTQYQKAHSENKAVNTAIDNIKKRLTGKNATEADKELWSKLENLLKSEGDSSSRTIAGLSRDEAIEKIAKDRPDLKKALEAAEKAVEGAERKAADPEKVKAAQDAFDAGEKSLKEMAESLGKKMTKGPNKWVAAAIGAAALGLATLLAVNSKNNKAQA